MRNEFIMSTTNTIEGCPIKKYIDTICFNAFDASPYIISNFLLYESERPPKKSVNDAAKSENILVPITILEQMVSIYFFIGQLQT